MKVRVFGYYAGKLTRDNFFNVKDWRPYKNDENLVDITFENVTSIEKLGDGVNIVFNACESHYFDYTDYATITIL
jgi:hypothetical protein